jgi:hypothetical protein
MKLDSFLLQLYQNTNDNFTKQFSYASIYKYYFENRLNISKNRKEITQQINDLRHNYYYSRFLYLNIIYKDDEKMFYAFQKEILYRESLLRDALLYPIRTKILDIVWSNEYIESIILYYKSICQLKTNLVLPYEIIFHIFHYVSFPENTNVHSDY